MLSRTDSFSLPLQLLSELKISRSLLCVITGIFSLLTKILRLLSHLPEVKIVEEFPAGKIHKISQKNTEFTTNNQRKILRAYMEFYMNWITITKIYMKMLELEKFYRFLYFFTAPSCDLIYSFSRQTTLNYNQ